MEQSIVFAMIILGSIFSVFAVIFAVGEINIRRQKARSPQGIIQKLTSKQNSGKSLTLQEVELLATLNEERSMKASEQIAAREERANIREEAKVKPAFQEYVHITQNKGTPSNDLRIQIAADNRQLGLASK